MLTDSTPEMMRVMQFEWDEAAREGMRVKEARDACRRQAEAAQPPRWKRSTVRISLGRIFAPSRL